MAIDRAAVLAHINGMKLSDLIDKFISLRDAVDVETNRFKARIKDATDTMDVIEATLMQRMKEVGVDSASSGHGTVFFTTQTRCGVADWDQLLPFIIDGNPQLLNKAVNKTAVKEYMDAHDGELPPGVKWDEEQVVQIRKK